MDKGDILSSALNQTNNPERQLGNQWVNYQSFSFPLDSIFSYILPIFIIMKGEINVSLWKKQTV